MIRNFALPLLACLLFVCQVATQADPIASIGPSLEHQSAYTFQKQGAEVLHSIARLELDEKGHWLRRFYYSIRINDQASARDYGRITIPFNHYYGSAKLEFARVRNHEGVIKSVSDDAVQIRIIGGGQDFYEDRSEIVFSMPDVEPGAILEFQFSNQTIKKSIETVSSAQLKPYWFQARVANDGWRADRVKDFDAEMILPKNLTPNFKVYGTNQTKPRTQTKEASTIYQWRWKSVPELTLEANMLPLHKVAMGIEFSSSRNWADVDIWTWEKIQTKLVSDTSIQQAIKKIALPATASTDEKVKAVYQYIQNNVRYVFAHLGRGGYDPHWPHETLANGYGDCKDQAVLAVALLRALGVDAYPTLVETPNAGHSDTELVSLIFDHMIVWLPNKEGGKPIWLDTTSDRALFPGVSGDLKGQTALIINGQGGRLIEVDAQFPDNQAKLTLTYNQQTKGGAKVVAQYQPSGIFEESLRQWWKHDNNRSTSMRQFLSGIFEDKGQYELTYDVLNVEELFKPAEISATYNFPSSSDDKQMTYAASFLQLYRLVGGFNSMQTPESRATTYYDSNDLGFNLQVKFVGLKNKVPTLVESGKDIKSPYFTFQQSGKTSAQDFSVQMHFQKKPLTLTPPQYQLYYDSLKKLGEIGAWVVTLADDPNKKAVADFTEKTKQHNKSGFDYQLALSKHLIEQGKFAEALIPAKAAVTLKPNDAEAWYILGTAQGFNTMVKESLESFERAESLGYKP